MTFPEVLKDFLINLPMQVVEASPYFGTFVLIRVVDMDGQDVHVRALMCDWVLKKGAKIIASSDWPMNECKPVFQLLVGSRMIDIVQHGGAELELIFDCGNSFFLRANLVEYEVEDELLVIYIPDQYGIGYSLKLGFRKTLVKKPLH